MCHMNLRTQLSVLLMMLHILAILHLDLLMVPKSDSDFYLYPNGKFILQQVTIKTEKKPTINT